MELLVSDSNFLIDLEVGGLSHQAFEHSFKFQVPDILFHEELSAHHGHLLEFGLELVTLTAKTVQQAIEWGALYRKASRIDLFALALAKMDRKILLTGDFALRQAAKHEAVEVHGTIWVVEKMVERDMLSISAARRAYERMQRSGRRLPWEIAIARLAKLSHQSPVDTEPHAC